MEKKKVKLVKMEVDGLLLDAKECTSCGVIKPLSEYNSKSNGLGKKASQCKVCRKAYSDNRKELKSEYDKKYREENKEKLLRKSRDWHSANREYANQKRKEHYKSNKEEHLLKCKEYREKNKEILNEKQRKYYKENRYKFIEYREKNKERITKLSKLKYQENKDKYSIRWKEYYEKNKERLLERNREWYYHNKEHVTKRWAKYSRSERGQEVISRLNHKRREREANTFATLTAKQWLVCKNHFSDCCAYCGKKEKMTKDHFVPVASGGELTVKNIIPACKSCNSSKCDKNFLDWYPKQEFYSATREKKILKYLDIKDNTQQIAMF